AHAAGRTFRITEMGTSAGSVPGVTDTFATALWAPDALFSMAGVGVDGVNVHIRAVNNNSALNATGPPRPLFYGLALVGRTLRPERGRDLRRDARRSSAERRRHLAGGATRAERARPRRPLHADAAGPLRRTADDRAGRLSQPDAMRFAISIPQYARESRFDE